MMARTLALALLLGALVVQAAPPADYLTKAEVDEIRDTQEIDRRIPLFLKFAETRLFYLGLAEGNPNEENKPGRVQRFALAVGKILQPGAKEDIEGQEKKAEEIRATLDADLREFSRSELLRGYHQALDEAMDNIDDAYERRRGDVRGPLEDLKKFADKSIPMLKRFEPENEFEEDALGDAIEQAELALEGATKALKTIPKTPGP